MQDFEKLGAFYLGKRVDAETEALTDEVVLYDSKDLTTHAVVVGMTGSGKTGLCLDLLEEAGLDRIPALVIDPKGDIANLLLTFPDLKPEDFRPWIDEGQAQREGLTPDAFAEKESKKWSEGLAGWGQDGERIRTLRESVDLQVYTPGSNAGKPLAILQSFAAPPEAVREDSDALRERVTSAASGLLALLGINADPIRSREHILISNLLHHAWAAGRDLDLGQLIGEIQAPPFQRVGIMELDTFFPAKDRLELAMTLNNLLASPSFSSWMSGDPLDIKRLLHTEEGKPRISILSIAHLNDAERMFFVTILLNEVLSWIRTQAGTSSLRAILYMDEVYGYFPPVANPPSKRPMLTLLKQARAYGLGVILATQNPVDLDYKGLSNTGTWFLGRLQTERDKARVIEGLEGAAASTGATFDRNEIEQILSGLGSRRFMMNNVHEDQPILLETRWAMSYLRGPLTRSQLQTLIAPNKSSDPSVTPKNAASTKPILLPENSPDTDFTVQVHTPHMLPSEIEQRFVRPCRPVTQSQRLVYRPALFATGRLHYVRVSFHVDSWFKKSFLLPVANVDLSSKELWHTAQAAPTDLGFELDAVHNANFSATPADMQSFKKHQRWQKEFVNYLYREKKLTLYQCKSLKASSTPEETLGDFKVRLEQLASEKRDQQVEVLRNRYAPKYATLRQRIRRAETRIDKEKDQYKSKALDSILSFGGSVMSALLGRKTVSTTNVRRVSTSMRSFGKAASERGDVGRAKEQLQDLHTRYEELELSFNEALKKIEQKQNVEQLEINEVMLSPRKSDISLTDYFIAWLPWQVDTTGIGEPLFESLLVAN